MVTNKRRNAQTVSNDTHTNLNVRRTALSMAVAAALPGAAVAQDNDEVMEEIVTIGVRTSILDSVNTKRMGDSISDVIDAGAARTEGIDFEAAFEVVRNEENPRRAMDRLITAASMLCPSQNVAATVTAAGGSAWVYHFTRAPVGQNGESLGAYHGVEYPYVFDTHDPYFATDEKDHALQEAMQTYWVNFAKTGNPNGDGVLQWPTFERPEMSVQELGDDVFTTGPPEPELCALFEEGLPNREIK